MSNEELIKKFFYNPLTGFGGVDKIYRALKKEKHKIDKKEIKDVLEKQEIYQTSKKNVGKSGSFVPTGPLFEFQIDLIYLDDKHLNKHSYGLVCIDTFTKKGDAELLKKKNAPEVTKAMETIMQRMGIPQFIYCDEGSEFDNAQFKALMKENKIELIFSLRHAPMVERLNRTLKEMLYKYLQSTNTKTITNVLPKILENYNNSYHRTIKMAPNEVNEKNEEEVYNNIMSQATIRNRPLIKVGDRVRVQLKRKAHDKGYRPKYSKQIYTVEKREGRYYLINGLDRKYLRAFIEKVGEAQINTNQPELEGTREGKLKEIAARPIDPEIIKKNEQLEKEREAEPVATTRPQRIRKRVDKPFYLY